MNIKTPETILSQYEIRLAKKKEHQIMLRSRIAKLIELDFIQEFDRGRYSSRYQDEDGDKFFISNSTIAVAENTLFDEFIGRVKQAKQIFELKEYKAEEEEEEEEERLAAEQRQREAEKDKLPHSGEEIVKIQNLPRENGEFIITQKSEFLTLSLPKEHMHLLDFMAEYPCQTPLITRDQKSITFTFEV